MAAAGGVGVVVKVRDKRSEASQELDDLGDGDGALEGEAHFHGGARVVGVHDDVHEGVEPHAPEPQREAVLEPAAHLPRDGRVVPEVEQDDGAAAQQQQHGVEVLPQLGREEQVEHVLMGGRGRSADHRVAVERQRHVGVHEQGGQRERGVVRERDGREELAVGERRLAPA